MLKPAIHALLRRFGLEVRRAPRSRSPHDSLQIGPWTLRTDNRELIHSYREFPLTNAVITRIVRALAARDSSVAMVDVGANCGDSAALAKLGHDLPILCIEPDAHVFSFLQANAAQFPDVSTVTCFLDEAPGTRALGIEKEGWNITLVDEPGASKRNLTFTTVDDVISSWPHAKHVGFLKCDAEGFDVRVLHGASRLLTEQQPVVLFEYNREPMGRCGEGGFRAFKFLDHCGYQTALFFDAFGRFLLEANLGDEGLLRDLHDYADGRVGRVLYYDILAFPARQQALAREFAAAERTFRTRGAPGQP